MQLTVAEVGGGILAAAALVATWWKIVRPAIRAVRALGDFLDDWNGRPERRDASGAIIEQGRAGWSARLTAMEHELHPNRGSSMKDSLGRIERAQTAMTEQISTLAEVDRADRAAASDAHRKIHERIDRLQARE